MADVKKYIRLVKDNGDVILTNLVDSNTGESVEYIKVSNPTGITPDGDVYRQLDTEQYGAELFVDTRFHSKGEVVCTRFGAKGDFNLVSLTGTDDTAAIQKAINFLISVGGGTLIIPTGKAFLVNGTVYINAPSNIPITIKGGFLNARFGNQSKSPLIARTVSGDVFRVNLTSDGIAYNGGSDQYSAFGFEGIICRAFTTGVNFIKTFRTRNVIKNIATHNCDWTILQDENDTAGNTNYCDQSFYENIRISYPNIGGLRINRNDGGQINGLYMEGILASDRILLDLNGCRSMSVDGIVFWTPPNPTVPFPTLEGSTLIRLNTNRGITLKNLHLERVRAENTFYLQSNIDIKIQNISTYFEYNRMFNYFYNNKNIEVDGWTNFANRNVAYTSDVWIGGGNSNVTTGFVFNNLYIGDSTTNPVTDRTGRALEVFDETAGRTVSAYYRKPIAIPDSDIRQILAGQATLDFTTVTANSFVTRTITVTGAVIGDTVNIGIPSESANGSIIYSARVSSANTVQIRANNISSSDIVIPSGLFKVRIIK